MFLVAIAAVAVAAAALGDGGEAVAGEEDQRAAALGEVLVHDAPRREETALAVVAVPAALVVRCPSGGASRLGGHRRNGPLRARQRDDSPAASLFFDEGDRHALQKGLPRRRRRGSFLALGKEPLVQVDGDELVAAHNREDDGADGRVEQYLGVLGPRAGLAVHGGEHVAVLQHALDNGGGEVVRTCRLGRDLEVRAAGERELGVGFVQGDGSRNAVACGRRPASGVPRGGVRITWSATAPTAASSSRCAWSREPMATPLIETSFIWSRSLVLSSRTRALWVRTLSGELSSDASRDGARRADVVRRGVSALKVPGRSMHTAGPIGMSLMETTGATTTGELVTSSYAGGISTATPETVTTGISLMA